MFCVVAECVWCAAVEAVLVPYACRLHGVVAVPSKRLTRVGHRQRDRRESWCWHSVPKAQDEAEEFGLVYGQARAPLRARCALCAELVVLAGVVLALELSLLLW